MANLFTKTPKQNCKAKNMFTVSFTLITLFSVFFTKINAQDVLAGINSNGGPEGKGVVFTMKTNGTNFSVIKGFADWGKTPVGDLLKGDDGNFYGMTSAGGTYTNGSIFMMTPAGAITILKQFNYTNDGAYPMGELVKGADGNFYGMTSSGGTNGYGTIFKITLTGIFTVIRHLSITADGSNPRGHLVLAKDGNFYGITYGGGTYGYGTIFKMTPSGTYTVLRSLNRTTDGANSLSSLTEGTDGNLYGITYYGGTHDNGTIFKITTAGVFTVLHNINIATDGGSSQSDLMQATDGNFYGMCYNGGANGNGTIFKITPSGTFTVMRALAWLTDGSSPLGNLYQNNDGFLYGMTSGGGTNSNGLFFKMSLAGTYTVLHSFLSATEGAAPKGGVVKGNDGNLYGMTSSGGTNTWGTAFKITTAGVLTPLVQFHGAGMGNTPYESLVKGKDSAYYGTTSSGGTYNFGTIFKICGGITTVLRSFSRTADGGIPKGSLIQATDGNFYGMASEGGSKSYGTIFKITPAGTYSVLYNLNSPIDGGTPLGSLVQGTDGSLYGMTSAGGTNGTGTIFKISLAGTFTVLHQFVLATEGGYPEGNLIQATDGNFYGITSSSSARIFKMAADGTVTVLRTLNGNTDGSNPVGSLVQSADGKLYGTASYGGTFGSGTIFSITTTGTFKTLKHINGTTDGKTPKGNLLIGNDGNFYGMTSVGGTNNVGTIFKMTASGTYTVLRQLSMATDGGNPYGSLIIAPVNNFVANTQSITTDEDTKKTITLSGSGGSPLSYIITTSPKRGKLSGAGANKTYTPNANYSGKDSFYFSVSVGCISSAPAIVRITVNPIADTPVLASIGNKSVVKNTTLTFTATATDGDANTKFNYSLIGAPVGASINATSGVFTWTPATAGSYSFKVRVTDNSALALYDEETITVTVTNTLTALTSSDQQQAITKVEAFIYPNPVNDKCYVTFNAPAEEVIIRIVDINGKIISTNSYQAFGKNRIEINAAQLSRGIYFAQIQTAEGNVSLKFIKQ